MITEITTLGKLTKDGKGNYGIAASAVPFSEELFTYLRITDIKDDGTLNRVGLMSVDDDKAEKYILQPNDIVFARTGGSTGRNYFYDGSDGRLVYAGFLIKFSIDPKKVNPKYVKYYCQSSQYYEWVNSYNNGSTRGNINAQTYANMSIPLLPRLQQDKLVKILSVIDEKIEINTAINDNLHEQIQALYLSNFDPAIQKPTGILSDICYYSSKKIPIAMLTVDTYFSTENMQANKIGAIKATSLPNISQTTKCYPGDVLVSNIRPYFKKIVYVASECGCSTDVLCFCPNTERLSAFLFSTLYVDRFFDYMVAGSKGTKMPRGDKKQIMNYPIVIPSDIQLQQFNTSIVPMLNQIELLKMETMRLAEIRDALLPQLMSGELDVSTLNL